MDISRFKDLIRNRQYYEAAILLLESNNFDLELALLRPLYLAWKGGQECGKGKLGDWEPEELLKLVDQCIAEE